MRSTTGLSKAAVLSNDDSPSRSAANVLRLVLMLADRGRLRVMTVAEELGVAPSTAHRLLATLLQSGLAAQHEDRSYVQGPAFVRLRLAPSHPDALLAIVVPHLTKLSAASGETTHCMIREEATVRFIHSIEGPGALRVASRTGMVMPAHLTSGGKALIATMSDDAIRELYANGIPDSTASRIRTIDDLFEEIAQVRKRGYAENNGQSEPGISAVGVALRRNGVQAAISVSVPSTRYRRDRSKELVALLTSTVAAIQAQP
jgi:DNA-binding IclR family transcriptional regulator